MLAPVFYFLPALLRGKALSPDDDLLQNVPFRAAAAQIIRSGHLPLWNPYIFSGMPLFATAQVGILFPLNWFYLFFSPATATNLMVVSTYMVAGLGAYLYARRIGASLAGAAITSLAWQFSGAAVGQIGHINIVQTSAILPWVLWSLQGYAAKGTFKRGAILAAIIAVQFFAGHQQTFVNSLLLVIAYVVVMAIANRESRRRYLTSVVFVGMGLLLAAVQMLPTFELLRRSERSAATYEFFTSFSMPKRFVLELLAPYIMGGGDGRLFRAPYVGPPFYTEMVGYVGVLTIMLAVIALVRKPDVRTQFWAAIAAICLLLAFGAHAPLDLYKGIYYLPVLNLFRVPARHLMEVDFALAVLAGRGFTILAAQRHFRSRTIVILSAGSVLVLTVLAVTVLRPATFHLAREAPVTILRAPELFMPIAIAAVSAYALWRYARGKRGAILLVFVVLLFDLAMWGQSSGWYVASPQTTDEYWHQPKTVQALNSVAPGDRSSYRILTAPHQFDPNVPPVPPSVSHSTDWVLWTQPDVYMMHGIQNAAGYDGFGLERYSELVGRMKVWGELTDPDTTLRSDSREIDVANVRYLLSMRRQSNSPSPEEAFAKADQRYGDYMFAANDLGVSSLSQGKRLSFSVPPVEIDHIGLVSQLAWSENVPDDTTVARLRLQLADGRTLEVTLRAGADTSEWAYDRPDIRARIRHRRATVASSYQVNDAKGNYDAHMFVTAIALPEVAKVTGGEIVIEPDSRWPDLSLSVFRLSLINQQKGKTYALGRNLVKLDKETEAKTESSGARWKLVAQTKYVDIYENGRTMPRAWLAPEMRVLDEAAMLNVIRSGKFADGSKWDPATTALIESPIPGEVQPRATGDAQITRYEPNRINVSTKASGGSILVLSENHYPGWRTYLDGRAVETLRIDYNLRGVPLPAGEHLVEFTYRPKSVLIGMAISLFAIALLSTGILVDRKYQNLRL